MAQTFCDKCEFQFDMVSSITGHHEQAKNKTGEPVSEWHVQNGKRYKQRYVVNKIESISVCHDQASQLEYVLMQEHLVSSS